MINTFKMFDSKWRFFFAETLSPVGGHVQIYFQLIQFLRESFACVHWISKWCFLSDKLQFLLTRGFLAITLSFRPKFLLSSYSCRPFFVFRSVFQKGLTKEIKFCIFNVCKHDSDSHSLIWWDDEKNPTNKKQSLPHEGAVAQRLWFIFTMSIYNNNTFNLKGPSGHCTVKTRLNKKSQSITGGKFLK